MQNSIETHGNLCTELRRPLVGIVTPFESILSKWVSQKMCAFMTYKAVLSERYARCTFRTSQSALYAQFRHVGLLCQLWQMATLGWLIKQDTMHGVVFIWVSTLRWDIWGHFSQLDELEQIERRYRPIETLKSVM